MSSALVRAASRRSHSAISSSTFATMRRCSARGGRGIGIARSLFCEMFICITAMPDLAASIWSKV